MKILAVAHDLPPSLSPQSIQIGRLLYHLAPEHRLHVATSDYPTPRRCDAYEDLPDRLAGRVAVRSVFGDSWLGLRMRLFPLLYRLPEPCLHDMPRLRRAVLRAWGDESFDRLLTFAYPFSSHLLGLSLKRRFACRWLAHFSDPWADNPLMGYGPLSRTVNAWLESKVFQNADRLVFVSRETRDFYATKYPKALGKMAVLEHSFDPALFPPDEPPTDGPLVLRFIGNLYGGRSPEALFAALQALRRQGGPAIKVEFVLAYPRALEGLIRESGLHDVVALRQCVDYKESLRLMKTAPALLTFENPVPRVRGLFLPSKLADFMGAGRPILALAAEGATRRVVEAYGGWAVDPGDGEHLRRTLLELAEAWSGGRLRRFSPAASTAAYAAAPRAREFAELLR